MTELWITLISIGVTVLFILGIPIFLIIGLWVVGVSLVILVLGLGAARLSRQQELQQ